jgi:hypothetical protein
LIDQFGSERSVRCAHVIDMQFSHVASMQAGPVYLGCLSVEHTSEIRENWFTRFGSGIFRRLRCKPHEPMATSIEVPYNDDLKPLERALAGVRRPGNFVMQGSLEAPMPRIDVRDVGILSFPIPDAQVEALIAQCERAPYGRGRETLLDTTVRKVWQLAPPRFDIGGKSWPGTFDRILASVIDGLGCADASVSAELYKLLVYDEGAFFKAHRDTEKTEGMFGTLLIVLPSPHTGGQLIVRHTGREVAVDLSGDEVAELKFAAFYADCEHEVLPITYGNRVCLVYNLLQQPQNKNKNKNKNKSTPQLVAPLYEAETAEATKQFASAFARPDAPTKIAWLLEHQYSPAGLSFEALKGADKARATAHNDHAKGERLRMSLPNEVRRHARVCQAVRPCFQCQRRAYGEIGA